MSYYDDRSYGGQERNLGGKEQSLGDRLTGLLERGIEQGEKYKAGGYRPGKKMVIGAAALAAMIGYFSIKHNVGQTEVGAKFNKITGSCEALTAGDHFFLPIVNDWYKLDTALVSTSMTAGKDGDKEFDDRLSFKTRDGNEIKMDLRVPYQKNAAMACQIITDVGHTDEAVHEKVVRPYVRSIPRDHFGALSSQHFANTPDRNRQAQSAKKDLEVVMGQYGVIVKDVNTGTYTFENKEYRDLVQKMKVAESTLPSVRSSREAQVEENNRWLNDAEKYKKEMIATADGSLNQTKVQADGYFNQKKAEATGILTQGRNRAEAIRKERESMMSGGGKTQIQMQIAKCLRDKPIIPVPYCGSNPGQLTVFDLNKFMTQYATTQAVKAADAQGQQ